MHARIKTVLAAAALGVGLAATPALAQFAEVGPAPGYNRDGTLNVFGARIDPLGTRPGAILPLAPLDVLTTGALGERAVPRYGVERPAPAF